MTAILKEIELDCAPGFPRPGDLLPAVIDGTGLTVRDPISTFMGNWTWDFSDVSDETWAQAVLLIGPRIRDLYVRGSIRYGSW